MVARRARQRAAEPADLVAVAGRLCRGLGAFDPPRAARAASALTALRVLEARGFEPEGQLWAVCDAARLDVALEELFSEAAERYGATLAPADAGALAEHPGARDRIRELYAPAAARAIGRAPIEAMGQAYEQCLTAPPRVTGRKGQGMYYTPRELIGGLVDQTLDRRVGAGAAPAALRVVDPACGAGVFLISAYERLMLWRARELSGGRGGDVGARAADGAELDLDERRRLLEACIFGADVDEHAVWLSRLALALRALDSAPGGGEAATPRDLIKGLAPHIVAGDALVPPEPEAERGPEADAEPEPEAPPCAGESPRALRWSALAPAGEGGFDVVLGNPPWGQKSIRADPAARERIRDAFPSTAGIFDWHRPFVELGVRLLGEGGALGMVLPDILLLKNYEPTRRLLLESLALTRIEWFGRAFATATIDAITLSGERRAPPPGHEVEAVIHDGDRATRRHAIPQHDFHRNPRCALNLELTPDRRAALDRLLRRDRLGDYFEAHEGVHSGNIRAELFVRQPEDHSCEPLLFGRDELRPYELRWAGWFVRLSALPARRSKARYANLGRASWHARPKVVVRRTSDRLTAAVDERGRYLSNNFFLVLSRRPHPLDLDGLCALLNSELLTWFFRAVEPRRGRAFAELKIKHLRELPLPGAAQGELCAELNRLGGLRARAAAAGGGTGELDGRIERVVEAIFES